MHICLLSHKPPPPPLNIAILTSQNKAFITCVRKLKTENEKLKAQIRERNNRIRKALSALENEEKVLQACSRRLYKRHANVSKQVVLDEDWRQTIP